MSANEIHCFVAPDADTIAAFDRDGDVWRWCDTQPIDGVLVAVFHRDVRLLLGGIACCLACGECDTEMDEC